MRYKLVIFDFDGTLADSLPWFIEVFDTLADKFAFRRLDRSNLEALKRMDSRDLLKAHDVPLWKVPMIGAHAKSLQNQNIDKIKRFDGIADVLNALDDMGVTIAIVTSNAQENVERVLGPSTAKISHFACGATLFGKGAKFKAVMKAAGATASETISIGDELRDIEAAREVGVKTGAVTWGYAAADRLALEKPDHMFERPDDITALFA